MKKALLFLVFIFSLCTSFAQSVGIGTSTPDASAQLDVSASNKGFLPPRMSTLQRDAIQNPAPGLQVYNTTTDCLEIFSKGKWYAIFCAPSSPAAPDSLTDIDGNSYATVKICDQTWMQKNLNVSRYRNGDLIPQVSNPSDWASLTTGAWCWYNNDSATYGSVYGRLYNWYAVNDPRGLAPKGWHVPSNNDWNILVKCVDPLADTTCFAESCIQSNTAGEKLKANNDNYCSSNNLATNSSGFSAYAGGFRHATEGLFYNIDYGGNWWSSSFNNNMYPFFKVLYCHDNNFLSGVGSNNASNAGFYVRCIKDTPITTLSNGLVAYYPFSGNAGDSSGNGNHGTVNGATLTTDRFGGSNKAYSFMNISDKIVAPSINCDGILKYSISGWFKKDLNASFGTIFAQSNGCNGSDGLRLFIGTDNILYWQSEQRPSGVCSGAGKRDVSHNFNDNQWHSFAVTYDGVIGTLASNQFNIFIDGILVESAENVVAGLNVSTPITNTTFSTTLGNVNNNVDAMRGILDDIRIYNRVLTQAEITYLANH